MCPRRHEGQPPCRLVNRLTSERAKVRALLASVGLALADVRLPRHQVFSALVSSFHSSRLGVQVKEDSGVSGTLSQNRQVRGDHRLPCSPLLTDYGDDLHTYQLPQAGQAPCCNTCEKTS